MNIQVVEQEILADIEGFKKLTDTIYFNTKSNAVLILGDSSTTQALLIRP